MSGWRLRFRGRLCISVEGSALRRTVCLALLLWLSRSAVADAHLTSTNVGPFYDGIAHFFTSPEDILPVIAIVLLAGLAGLSLDVL